MAMRTTLALTLAALGIGTLTACGGSDEPPAVVTGDADGLVAAAKEEGRLSWYSDLPDAIIESTIEGFEDEYGITVEHIRTQQGQLAQRFSSEMDAGEAQADVLNIASKGFFDEALANDWFATIDADTVASIADYPSDYVYDDTYALINVQPLGIAYNTDTSEVTPEDWADLDDPALQGRLMIGDPEITAYLQQYHVLKQDLGDDFIGSLGSLDPQVVESLVPGSQQMAAGEADVVIPALTAVVQPLIDSGAPVAMVIPDDTTGVNQYAGVVEGAAHPNAGRLFMSYLLSPAGQERLTAGVAASVLDDIPGALELPSGFVAVPEDEVLADKDAVKSLLGL